MQTDPPLREGDPSLDGPLESAEVDAATDDIDDSADDSGDGDLVLPWWQNPINIIVTVVSAALIAGMIGWLVGDTNNSIKSNDADVGFLQDMWGHHDQAILMSQMFLTLPDVSPDLAIEANNIIRGQAQETGMMIQLLNDMNAPLVSESGYAMEWMGMQMDPDQMPGMATPEQLDELANSSGVEADNLFVDLMVAHHQGGIDMANEAMTLASNDWVQTYAEAWARNQAGEITELEALRPNDG